MFDISCYKLFWETDSFIHDDVKYIFQIGRPRTATTLQFQIVCALTKLKFPNKSLECTYVKVNETFSLRTDILVIKHHDYGSFKNYINQTDAVFFATQSEKKNLIIPDFLHPLLTVDMDSVKEHGDNIVDMYQPIFQLADDLMKLVQNYIGIWQTLRYFICYNLHFSMKTIHLKLVYWSVFFCVYCVFSNTDQFDVKLLKERYREIPTSPVRYKNNILFSLEEGYGQMFRFKSKIWFQLHLSYMFFLEDILGKIRFDLTSVVKKSNEISVRNLYGIQRISLFSH